MNEEGGGGGGRGGGRGVVAAHSRILYSPDKHIKSQLIHQNKVFNNEYTYLPVVCNVCISYIAEWGQISWWISRRRR